MLPTEVRCDGPRWLRSPSEIQEYRRTHLTVDRLLSCLAARSGGVLLSVEPGVGKTTLVDGLVEQHLVGGTPYDLIIYLTSRRDILAERPWIRRQDVAMLSGRPRARCGALDARWRQLEAMGCNLVARNTLCSTCPALPDCPWPTQMTADALAGKRVIAGVQSFLSAVPEFVPLVSRRVQSCRPLVILDEAFVIDSEQRAKITRQTIQQSQRVFARVTAERCDLATELKQWHDIHTALLDAEHPINLLAPLPPLKTATAEALQEVGIATHGDQFHFIGNVLVAMLRSRRWRDGDDVLYVRRPRLADAPYVVAAAHLPIELARHRLDDPDLVEFNSGVRILHEQTQVFNLRSSLGALRYFSHNAPQIIFAFAQLIAQLHVDGKRSLAVIKKRLASRAAERLALDLNTLTGKPFRVVVNPSPHDLEDPLIVPLITFGVQGLNCYEGFDAVFALSSFNARQDILEQRLNDAHGPGEELPITFTTVRGRRQARAKRYFDQRAGFDPLVASYARQYEANVVIQALGRVRFATQPRLVISFQTTPLDYPLVRDFRRLEDLRRHFGLLTRRQWQAQDKERKVAALADGGLTPDEISATTGTSRSTVYRILQRSRTSPMNDISIGVVGLSAEPSDPEGHD